ncbi:MAG: GNAT family N-acetyltransferase [Chloroflexi bacterium]|nr:MAG: GNAT family N-acetyltransferase [Chloroflexota bacterium]
MQTSKGKVSFEVCVLQSVNKGVCGKGMELQELVLRPAETADFERCLALDHSIETRQVWQMTLSGWDGALSIRFQPTRLPRPVRITYPYTVDELHQHWLESDCVLVAEIGDSTVGYLTLKLDIHEQAAWLGNVVIAPPQRRIGVGSALLKTAVLWAKKHQSHQIMTTIQARNFPAISFVQKNGFSFCGYNEFWYQTGDIGLFFRLGL